MLGSTSPRGSADGFTALAPLVQWMLLESAYRDLAAPRLTRFVPAAFIAAIPALTGQLWGLLWLLIVVTGLALGRPVAAAFDRHAGNAERAPWVRRYRLVVAAQSACLGAGGLLVAFSGSMPAALLAAAAIAFALTDAESDPFLTDAAAPRIALLAAPLVLGAAWRATLRHDTGFLELAAAILVWTAGTALLSRQTAARIDAIKAALHKPPTLAPTLVAETEGEKDFQRLVGRDQVTGLPNRQSFTRLLAQESERAVLAAVPLTLVLVAWTGHQDHAETHSEADVDAALSELAKRLRTTLRRRLDVIASLGQGKFALLLPATDAFGGDTVAKAALASVLPEDAGADAAAAQSPIKIGCATYRGKGALAPNDLLEFAEEALKHARNTQRQSIRHYDPIAKATRPPPFKGKRPKEENRFAETPKPPRARSGSAVHKPVAGRKPVLVIEAPAAKQGHPTIVLQNEDSS